MPGKATRSTIFGRLKLSGKEFWIEVNLQQFPFLWPLDELIELAKEGTVQPMIVSKSENALRF